MKIRNLFFAVLASAAVLAGCEKKEDLGTPSITFSQSTIEFDKGGDTKSVKITATRDWTVSEKPDWVKSVTPSEGVAGKDIEVKVTVDANTEFDRDGKIKFMAGPVSENLVVKQAGESGSSVGTIAGALAAKVGDHVAASGVVMATYNSGFVMSDGTDVIVVFGQKQPNFTVPEVGSKVDVDGYRAKYFDCPQITPGDKKNEEGKWEADPENKPLSVTVTGTAEGELIYPTPTTIAGAAADETITPLTYIQFKGKMAKTSGKYYNVILDGTSKKGSVEYPDAKLATAMDDMDGKIVVVTGYYMATTLNGTLLATMATSVEVDENAKYFNVTPLSLPVGAEAGTAKFSISSNVAWTATSDNDKFKLSESEGNGDAEITVTYEANESEEKVYANITVSTTNEEVAVKSYTVIVTQEKKPAAGETKISWTAPDDWTGIGEDIISYTMSGYTLKLEKTKGASTKPTVNKSKNDCRAYAKNIITISSETAFTSIVFNISENGLKRLCTVTADKGTIATQAKGDKTVSWTGNATEVTFTVGDNSDFGTESGAGQLCFDSINIAK